ncbi:MAG: hypothetical protein ABJG15_07970 [Hyphomonadaceae bacterium]
MFETVRAFSGSMSVFLIGIAVGGAWICTMVGPNVFYDKLDGSRAGTQVKALLLSGSTPIAGLLLAASAFAFLGGAIGAGVLSLLSAIGFFFNRWTLAPHKRGKTPPGASRRRKGQRLVAVGFSLMFLLVAIVAGVLAILGV